MNSTLNTGDVVYQLVSFLVLLIILMLIGRKFFPNNIHKRLARMEEKIDRLYEEIKDKDKE